MRLPLAASPDGASCAQATPTNAFAHRAAPSAAMSRDSPRIAPSSAGVGDDVDYRRLPVLDRRDSAFERRSKVVGIDDRPFAMRPHPARDGGIVHVRILDGGADIRLLDAAPVARGHRLQVHIFL